MRPAPLQGYVRGLTNEECLEGVGSRRLGVGLGIPLGHRGLERKIPALLTVGTSDNIALNVVDR